MSFILVPDINAHLERTKSAGGRIVAERIDRGVPATAMAKG
jgi:predicted enzyme related to lactoylglutathione lyase